MNFKQQKILLSAEFLDFFFNFINAPSNQLF